MCPTSIRQLRLVQQLENKPGEDEVSGSNHQYLVGMVHHCPYWVEREKMATAQSIFETFAN